MQTTIVFAIVFLAFVYAAWILMPAALRRRLASVLSGVAPAKFRNKLERVSLGIEEPGCSTCKACADAKPAAAGVKTMELRRR